MIHGETQLRGIHPPQSQFHSRGRFGRLFPELHAFAPDLPKIRAALAELGKQGGLMDANDQPAPAPSTNPDNEDISAGFTFFGQFIDHDLTFDPTSILERQNDPEALENFRTPALELDNLYGAGPRAARHFYDTDNPAKFLVDPLSDAPGSQDDMPRNRQATAIISDPRNDENVIVSQLHVAFLKFHNAVVDHLLAKGTLSSEVFEEAQRMVRWHYQWIVLKEFLPKIAGPDVVRAVLSASPRARLFQWRNEPFIPVEFSVAAYRFGHSQVRPGYRVNQGFAAGIFNNAIAADVADPNDLRGGKRAQRRFVEWDLFFPITGATRTAQLGKRIDTRLSSPLFALIAGAPGQPGGTGAGTAANPLSLAQRNLLRSLALSLPSGQAMAKRMGIKPLTPDQLAELKPLGVGFDVSTPPWYYMLKEAEVNGGGKRLSGVGARIVAEVLIGMLQGDRQSFLNANPDWKPELGNSKGQFFIEDLLKFAGVKVGP
ncbi:peroxidase family protein [Stigmatella aurantiaca]|uniref:Myeloperoxidase, thyroid peroxidase, cyclooxygenase catalytic domain n=1 Tax=Stigmatella aurantiaca (strain DW4/3-1) TaxID=378806 RepID=Q08WB9_STIAD|nr:heme peroxidase family protein [Stigmatella aurantiaca]ADO69268.1 myeloperoxidase, thyroid peroxidase-like protein [Stigmatella aurantiaca DW4/3-1]EAU64772.1 myeloperoxidase, thyroid peroxidase, cyclooxygenase catalytic domain [Stigmatella aurantiaca DW4/3-1]